MVDIIKIERYKKEYVEHIRVLSETELDGLIRDRIDFCKMIIGQQTKICKQEENNN